MYEISTEIEIDATPGRVWSVLTDFPAYESWNTYIRSIKGKPEEGTRLIARMQPEGGKAMTFRPTVLRAEANRELRWRGRLLFPGIFDGEHYFRIEPAGDGKTRFVHGEKFNGLLVPVLKSKLDREIRQGFEAMNRGLKARAEAGG
jgi:hypothetical protein